MHGTTHRNRPLIVIGSTNKDLTIELSYRPQAGETVIAKSANSAIGGKGANQALAASRAGADVQFVTALGPDGKLVKDSLSRHSIHLDYLVASQTQTGQALVMVTEDGENSIIVIPGANHTLDVDYVKRALNRMGTPESVVLLQCEIPRPVIAAAITAAAAKRARVVLNLAPFIPLEDELLNNCDPLVVNETEASALLGRPVENLEAALVAAEQLTRTSQSVVITLGGNGAVVSERGGIPQHVPGKPVQVVDTTGAGDAFVGALCAALTQGMSLMEAARAGNEAGAQAVQYRGAQPPAHASITPSDSSYDHANALEAEFSTK